MGAGRLRRGDLVSVADILSSVDLLRFVPPSAKLRPTGRGRWRGNCPIMEHSRPGSFEVKRHRDGHYVFSCFSCSLSGDVINLVAALDRITVGEAVRKLRSGATKLSPAAEMQRAKDSFDRRQGAYVLACVAPRCLSEPLQLTDNLEVALALVEAGHAQHWAVASDGCAALCPVHA
jgi:DNA primase